MGVHRVGAILIVASACALDAAVPDTPSASTAAEVLRATDNAYRNATTFTDHGSVTTVFTEAGRSNQHASTFDLAFRRPDGFRFEYRETIAAAWAMVLWSDMHHTLTESGKVPEIRIAAATGVSTGTAQHDARLLMPELDLGRALTSLDDATLEGRPRT